MSYEYKTILRREGHTFDYYKNRWNSRTSSVISIDKSGNTEHVAIINNKTGYVSFTELSQSKFKKTTLDVLYKVINLNSN